MSAREAAPLPESTSTDPTIAFVVIRLSSSRLPAKQLRKIGDRTILEWTLHHLRKSEEIDQIVIATVAEEENRPLLDIARDQGVPCFWYEGEVDHVTTRLRLAAETYGAGICLLVSGDCPLLHAPSLDRLIRSLRDHPEADYVTSRHKVGEQFLGVHGVSIARRATWQRADDMSDRPELKEHQFPIIGRRPDCFKGHTFEMPPEMYSPLERLSVDTLADLTLMNTLHDELTDRGLDFELDKALELVRERPELVELNAHVHQRRIVEDIKKVLYVVETSSNRGTSTLRENTALARHIVERLSWPVTFLTTDEQVEAVVTEQGFRTISGSLVSTNDSPWTLEDRDVLRRFDIVIVDLEEPSLLPTSWRDLFEEKTRVVALGSNAESVPRADLAKNISRTPVQELAASIKSLVE